MKRALAALAVLAAAGALGAWAAGAWTALGPLVILALAGVATFFQLHHSLRIFTFTFWVLTCVAAALFYPAWFLSWGGFELKRLNVPLIQLIMFGMGASLSFADFARALRMPKAVLIGIVLQFAVMPLTGRAIADLFGFPAEVAAGVILIGSCSGGVASNVMVYLAKGNVALSVTMTACSTLMAPLMTPLAMKYLAGQLIEIDFVGMMLSILYMVILPVGGGLVANRFLRERRRLLDHLLPVISMAAICFIIGIITANSRDQLLTVGFLLIAAAILHNFVGYVLGYTGARLLGLEEINARTVAFEVGMQNGGMATGLAIEVLKSTDAALGPGIFGTWMNISGSTLASWWRGRPPLQPPREPRLSAEPAPPLAT